MSKPIPINGIVTSVCMDIFAISESCYFSEIKARVEKLAGQPIGEGYLANAIDDLGFIVNSVAQPWVVSNEMVN